MAADQPEDQAHPSETVVSILSRSNQQALTESAKPCLLSLVQKLPADGVVAAEDIEGKDYNNLLTAIMRRPVLPKAACPISG
jgi:hypothetical protein